VADSLPERHLLRMSSPQERLDHGLADPRLAGMVPKIGLR
jgi:hypothetical protein